MLTQREPVSRRWRMCYARWASPWRARYSPSVIKPRLAIDPHDGRPVVTPTPNIPSSALNGIAKTPKQGLSFVRSSLDDCPAFAFRQADDAVDMASFNPVTRTRRPLDECALPIAVGKEGEDFFHVPSGENGRFERPRMIVWMDVRLGPYEPVQCATIVEMVFDERWRHPLSTDYRRTEGR